VHFAIRAMNQWPSIRATLRIDSRSDFGSGARLNDRFLASFVNDGLVWLAILQHECPTFFSV
jgi:hypothetical protein